MSFRCHNGDDDKNITQNVTVHSMKLQWDYPNSLTLSNVGKLSWS